MKKLLCLRKRVSYFFFSFLFISFSQVQSQVVVNHSGFPNDTEIRNCPSNCEAILPAIAADEEYHFTIPLTGGDYTTATVNFDTTWTKSLCSTLKQNTVYLIDKNLGTIDFTPGALCSDHDTLIIRIVAEHLVSGITEYLICKFPVKYRLPVKTVLVLDISGSMGTPVTATSETRWDVLKKSVEVYNIMYEFFRQEDDQVGLTYFTNNVIPSNPPLNNGFIDVTEYTASPSTTNILTTDMNTKGPMSLTAMGKGLLDAKNKLKSDLTSRYRKIVVLFTDGYQNVDPKVDINNGNSFYGVGSSGQFLNDYEPDRVDSIRYFNIATWGAAAGPTPIVLTNIANNSNAYALIATNTAEPSSGNNDIYNYFWATLEDILKGGSLQVVGNKFGKLTNSEICDTFNINSDISKASFVLTHKEGDNISISIEKDGVDITELVTLKESSFYKIIGLNFPLNADSPINSEGKYIIKVSGTTQNLFELTCMVDDHFFNYECSMDKGIYKTGDVMRFNTHINYAGNNITDNNDSVKVVLLKPGDDINHLIATYETPDLVITDDGGDPVQQKFEYLYKNNSDFYDALLSENQIIDLNNQGDGYFTGEYTDTYITGVYEVIYLIKVKDETKGYIQRKDIQSAVFEFGQSNPLDFVAVNETIPPSAPSNVVASDITQSVINLSWQASTDDSGISDYEIYVNGNNLISVTDINHTVSNLSPGTTYEFFITAEDAFGNISVASNPISVTTLNEVDTTKPLKPENLSSSNIAPTSVYLSWNASIDANGIKEYIVYKNNEALINTVNLNYSVTDLTPNTSYSFSIAAVDFATNVSEMSQVININTLGAIKDITAPKNLIANDISLRSLNLTWEASNSNTGILEYLVYKDGALISTTATTNQGIDYLSPSTEYKFHIIARDHNGNLSEASNYLSVTTQSKSLGNIGILAFKFRPKNKYGYYLGPGFKSMMKCKYLSKKSGNPIAQKSSIQDADNNKLETKTPFVKDIVEKLDGTYYIVLANVAPKTNPSMEIMLGEDILHSGPVYKIPIWFFILLVIVLMLVLIFRKNKKSVFYKILWLILLILIILWILHKSGQLFFLYML